MRAPKRRNTLGEGDIRALAARLPDDLTVFGLSVDHDRRRAEIAAWIDGHSPGQGDRLADAVMDAAGLTYLFSFRERLTAAPQ